MRSNTAQPGDVIVLAGKGHEDYQEICGVKHPMDERVLIKEVLEELKEEIRCVFADVIVDIQHEKLDKIFQYRIPERLKDELHPGMEVIIPFGKGNRQIKGYVTCIIRDLQL